MANDLDQLLLAYNIDLRPMKAAAASAEKIIDELEAKWAASVGKFAGANAETVAAHAKSADSVDKVVAATKEAIAATQSQGAATTSVVETLRAEILQHQAKKAAIQAETAEIAKQTAEVRKRRLEELAGGGGEKKEHGEVRGSAEENAPLHERISESTKEGVTDFGKNVLGGGTLASEIASGVANMNLYAIAAGVAVEAMATLGEKIHEAVDESSRLANVRNNFEQLAKGAGIEMPEALEKLRAATHNTVDDMALLRLGTAQINSGMKVTSGTMAAYTQAVVELARGTGHTASEAVQALTQTMLTGRSMALASVVGINRYQLALDQVGVHSRGAAAGLAQTSLVLNQLSAQYKAVGGPALTLDDHLLRLKVSSTQLFEEFAAGLAGSSGLVQFGTLLDTLSAKLEKVSEDISPVGQALGAVLSSMGSTVANVGGSITGVFKDISKAADDTRRELHADTESSPNSFFSLTFWQQFGAVTTAAFSIFETGVTAAAVHIREMFMQWIIAPLRQIIVSFEAAGIAARTFYTAAEQFAHGNLGAAQTTIENGVREVQATYVRGMRALHDEMAQVQREGDATIAKAVEEGKKKIDTAMHPTEGGKKDVVGTKPNPIPPAFDAAAAEKTARLRLQMLEAQAKDRLEVQATEIAAERELDQERYSAGLDDYQKYLAERKDLNARDHANRIAQIQADAKAQLDAAQAEYAAQSHQKADLENRIKAAGPTEGMNEEQRHDADAMVSNLLPGMQQYETMGNDLQLKRAKIKADTDAKMQEETTRANTAEASLDIEAMKQRIDTAQKTAEALLAIQTKQIAAEDELNKRRFENGQSSPEQYLQQQINSGVDKASAQVQAAQTVYNAGPKNDLTLATYNDKVKAAVAAAQEDITKIVESQTDTQLSYIEKVYGTQEKAIEAQLAFNKEFGDRFNTGYRTPDLLTAQSASVQAQLTQYEALFEKVNNDPTQQFSKNWWSIVDATQAAYTKLQGINDEMIKANDLATPIGNVFQTLGKGVQDTFQNARVKNFGSSLVNSGALLQNLGDTNQKFKDTFSRDPKTGKTGKTLPPEIQKMVDLSMSMGSGIKAASDPLVSASNTLTQVFGSLADAVKSAISDLTGLSNTSPSARSAMGVPKVVMSGNPFDAVSGLPPEALPNVTIGSGSSPSTGSGVKGGLDTTTDKVTQFGNKLNLAVTSLTSFVGAITSAKSAAAGAVGGGTGGFAMGSNIKSAVGDSLGSLGNFLPGIGAALGAVMGGIMGQKQGMVEHDLMELKITYQQMQEAYSSGNATLTQTITALQNLIQEAQQEKDDSKKGGSQFQDLINQYNQQMQQYLDQQQQILIQLNNAALQVALPQEGQDYSDYISSLQSVITQYEQYAGAATTAAETMQAQTYLQQSIASYQAQWSEQLNTDATTAVQDALTLNELIQQRNVMLQQTAQNERDILSQGTLTRQQTFAQSKAQKLAEAQYQSDLQLEQINQQIDLNTAKVNAEKQVFDLATTRIGLETQLLQLQEAAADRQVQQVQALVNVLATLQNGVSSNNSAVATQNNYIATLLAGLLANVGSASTGNVSGLLATFQQYASSGLIQTSSVG